MAGAAARENCRAGNVVLSGKRAPFFSLIVLRLPLHVEDIFLLSQEPLRLAMTFQAPLHLKRCDLPRQGHQINSPVTGGTPDTFVDVNAVIEIDEVGQVMHAGPLYGLARAVALTNRLQVRAVGKQHRMTIQASLGRRHTGESRRFDRSVAVAAINPVIARVVLVAELHGLLALDKRPRHPGRAVNGGDNPERADQHKDRPEDCEPG